MGFPHYISHMSAKRALYLSHLLHSSLLNGVTCGLQDFPSTQRSRSSYRSVEGEPVLEYTLSGGWICMACCVVA